MPGFDDRLTRELERAARPAAPDVVRTFSDVTRRRAKRTVIRRVEAVAVVFALLVGTAGAFALLDDRPENGRPVATETIAPPYHQMSAWRLQFRPVVAIDMTGLNVTCLPEECTEGDLDPAATVGLLGRDGQIHQLAPAFAEASDVSNAEAVELATGEWAVSIQLDLDATAALEAATEEAVGAPVPRNRIAVVLDGEVVSAPAVQDPITGGSLQVTGLGEEGSALLAAELSRGMPQASPSEPSEPSEPRGEDIGLATRLCDVVELGGLDLVGDGTPSTAWTGNPVNADGRCPRDLNIVVAADVTGDGRADVRWGPIEQCQYMGCAPLGGADLDADGDEELVIHTYFSIIDHLYFSFDPDAMALTPIVVADPGHPQANIAPDEPLLTSAGGDEGYSSWMRCEGYPGSPVLVWTWAYSPVESEDPVEWHETKLRLDDDGMFHVTATHDFHLPWGQEPDLTLSNARACGLHFNLHAAPDR